MTPTDFLLLFGAAAIVLAGLLAVAAWMRGGTIRPRNSADGALATFGWITVAGVLGIGWLLIQLLRYDGWMAEEFALCGGAGHGRAWRAADGDGHRRVAACSKRGLGHAMSLNP